MSDDKMQLYDENGKKIPLDCKGKGCQPKSSYAYANYDECEHLDAIYGQDWLGDYVFPGNDVLYAQMSGRCVQMVKGTVVDINTRRISIMPNGGNRWSSHYEHKEHYDTRTGKVIRDPYKEKFIKKDAWYEAPDGSEVTQAEARELSRQRWLTGDGAYEALVYHSTEFHEWVGKRVKPQRPVVITITNNITRWLPEAGMRYGDVLSDQKCHSCKKRLSYAEGSSDHAPGYCDACVMDATYSATRLVTTSRAIGMPDRHHYSDGTSVLGDHQHGPGCYCGKCEPTLHPAPLPEMTVGEYAALKKRWVEKYKKAYPKPPDPRKKPDIPVRLENARREHDTYSARYGGLTYNPNPLDYWTARKLYLTGSEWEDSCFLDEMLNAVTLDQPDMNKVTAEPWSSDQLDYVTVADAVAFVTGWRKETPTHFIIFWSLVIVLILALVVL